MESLIYIIAPLSITALILFICMFGHLKFGFISLKSVQKIGAVIGALYGYLYFTTMYNLLVDYSVFLSRIHYTNLVIFLIFAILIGFYSRRITPDFIQIIGLCVFGTSAYFLLA